MSSPDFTFCADSYSGSVVPPPDEVGVDRQCCPGIVLEPLRETSSHALTCNWSGNVCPQSSQLAESLWTDPGLKSEIGVCELSPLKKKKKPNPYNQGKNITSNLLFGDTHFKEGIDQQIFFGYIWLDVRSFKSLHVFMIVNCPGMQMVVEQQRWRSQWLTAVGAV